ncbi:F-box/kelch-repeat protein At3g23880-like [Neltuma alba]|uniref:F-box/kelch-repeat protein At3g23880-like n=1 Tax=Neltuma alba TaxID=207710 RepID=UPI0010A475D5|nr:F-box/kelch-repeat protein At3g23880-like [Prosopis alba]
MECDASFLPGDIIRNILKRLPMQVLEVHRAPSNEYLAGAVIIGSINGLLCARLSNPSQSILLWNPATRKVRLVARTVNSTESFKLGFGFSSVVNDHKIVSIGVFVPKDLIHRVEVYSLSTKSWKNVEFEDLLNGVAVKSDGFCTNGAIFWFGFKPNVGHLLVSYDIGTEMFTFIPSPISAPALHDSFCNSLTEHENKLAMLSHTTVGNFESSLVDLWVMEEGTGASGERWNWTKRYSIRHPCILLPGVIFRNMIICHFYVLKSRVTASEHEVLNDGPNIVTVNLTTDELKRFTFLKCGTGFGVFNYVESLVPVGNNDTEEL